MIGPLTYVPHQPTLGDLLALGVFLALWVGVLAWLLMRISRG